MKLLIMGYIQTMSTSLRAGMFTYLFPRCGLSHCTFIIVYAACIIGFPLPEYFLLFLSRFVTRVRPVYSLTQFSFEATLC
jgi:hypothetical protein